VNSPAKPTLADIARRAGVCKATVSLALRDQVRISARVRARVQRLAAEMGYRKNALVAAHMAHVRGVHPAGRYEATLGYLLFQHSAIGREHLAGARDRCERLGYRLDVFDLARLGVKPARLNAMLRSRGIPGLIVGENAETATKLPLEWEHFAAATVGYTLVEPNLPRVCFSHFRGMSSLLERMRAAGHRRIGYVARPGDLLRANRLQHAAFLEFHAEHDLAPGPVLLLKDETPRAFLDWVRTERPDAVISSDVRIPRWISSLRRQRPAFATLCWTDEMLGWGGNYQDFRLIAATAVDLVVGQLHRNERGVPANPQIVLIEGRWVDSTSPKS
jgi:LacI family transcriptional regulator